MSGKASNSPSDTGDTLQSHGKSWPDHFQDVGAALVMPIQILLSGLVVIGLVAAAKWALDVNFSDLWASLNTPGGVGQKGAPGVSVIVGGLVFLVGLGLLVFLWWLAAKFFGVVSKGTLQGDGLSAIKDLPFALPEGTIRAFLALIVAVVGLPILLFSGTLQLDAAIAGYLNGIITGVFAFYFGTRTNANTVPQSAVRTIANAENRAAQAEDDAASAKAAAEATRDEADRSLQLASLDSTVDQVQRHLQVAMTLVKVLGPTLQQSGVVPDGALSKLAAAAGVAQQALDVVKGPGGNAATADQLSRLTSAAGSLVGAMSGNTSVLGTLLSKAAPMLGGIAIPGIGPALGLVSVLSIAAQLGNAQYQRWRSRVLAAPIASGAITFGTVSPQDVEEALEQASRFRTAFQPIQDQPTFLVDLADLVLRDNGMLLMWQKWGADNPTDRTLFATRKELGDGFTEFQQALVTLTTDREISDTVVKGVVEKLANQAAPASSGVSPESVLTLDAGKARQLIAAVSGSSLKGATGDAAAPPSDAQAAFDALVMVVDRAKIDNVDIARTLRETV